MQRQPRRMILRFALSAAMLSILTLIPYRAQAQATAARSREAGISAFGTYTRLTTDYGQAVNAYTFGADYTRFFKYISPAVEVRFKNSQLGTVGERTIGGGIRAEYQKSYFHPYADFLISSGTITFAQKTDIGSNGTGSNGSVVYSFGGGVDYDFAEQWAARVDFQSESWNLHETPTVTLTPHALSFGILYRIHLHRNQYQ